MDIKERFLTVIVMNAAMSLILGIADAFDLDAGIFDLLVGSFFYSFVLFVACWFIAPWVYNKLNLKK